MLFAIKNIADPTIPAARLVCVTPALVAATAALPFKIVDATWSRQVYYTAGTTQVVFDGRLYHIAAALVPPNGAEVRAFWHEDSEELTLYYFQGHREVSIPAFAASN
jgi:hypothetical protein